MVDEHSRHILIVDDHGLTAHVMARLIRARGFHVVMAFSLEEARAFSHSHEIGFLITDLGLPDGDGCALLKELRAQLGIKGVAITGYGMTSDIARSVEAGFSMHFTKPIQIHDLERVLALAQSEICAGAGASHPPDGNEVPA